MSLQAASIKTAHPAEPVDLTLADLGLMHAMYDGDETDRHLGVGPTTRYELVKAGELIPIKIGRASRYTAHNIASIINKRRRAALSARGR